MNTINGWPDIKRVYEDPDRPGLIFTVTPEHIFLCPFEVEKLQKEYDEKHKLKNDLTMKK